MNRKNLSFVVLLVVGLASIAFLSLTTGAQLAAEGATADIAGDPHFVISLSPRLRSIPFDGTAEFDVSVVNTGSVPLVTLSVTSANATTPGCNMPNLGPLGVGATITYTCSRSHVTQSYLNVVRATGTAQGFPDTVRETDAFVEVQDARVRFEKGPQIQQVAFGGKAEFTINLQNISPNPLVVKDIDDNLVNDCDLHSIARVLLPGESLLPPHSCSKDPVEQPMTTIITATIEDTQTNETFTVSTAAWVDVLKLDATLTPSPASLAEPGGAVTYAVDLVNTGSIPMVPIRLTTDKFGNLLNPANPLVPFATNTCLQPSPLPSLAPYGGAYHCTFVVEVTSPPPAFALTLTAEGQSPGGLKVETEAVSSLVIENLPASMSLVLGADPSFISPPGRLVTFSIQILNTSPVDTLTITQLEDEFLGDLDGVGTCDLPVANLLPGSTYTCEFSGQVTGQDGETHSRTITAYAISDDDEELIESAVATVGITKEAERFFYIPMTADDVVEPNNQCGLAYPLTVGRQYYFLPPHKYDGNLPPDKRDQDYFTFTLDQAARVDIELTNFLPQFAPAPPQVAKGQLIVRGHSPDKNPPCVPAISQHIITQVNHVFQAAGGGVLQPGRYYIQIVNDGPSNVQTYYGLLVRAKIP